MGSPMSMAPRQRRLAPLRRPAPTARVTIGSKFFRKWRYQKLHILWNKVVISCRGLLNVIFSH
jgi:hypothetical protein